MKDNVERARAVLIEIMEDKDQNGQTRVTAAKALIEVYAKDGQQSTSKRSAMVGPSSVDLSKLRIVS